MRTAGEDLLREVTEAMTTNESFFFRDIKPFDQFKDMVLPQLLQTRATKRSFRIWSAASSSGQEPYSLAMLIKEEAAKLAGWRIEIVGTDISQEMLEKAKAGYYSQFEVQRGLPIQMLVKYFKKKDEMWQIDPAIRAMVQYREYNLLNDLKALGQFDVVFCRNVLIYFDQPTKSRVLENISKIMPDDGILYLGGAETVLGISDKFKPIPNQRGIYCVNRDPSKALQFPAGAGAK
jgi:chemotaxis protein methyltransferase CheR